MLLSSDIHSSSHIVYTYVYICTSYFTWGTIYLNLKVLDANLFPNTTIHYYGCVCMCGVYVIYIFFKYFIYKHFNYLHTKMQKNDFHSQSTVFSFESCVALSFSHFISFSQFCIYRWLWFCEHGCCIFRSWIIIIKIHMNLNINLENKGIFHVPYNKNKNF